MPFSNMFYFFISSLIQLVPLLNDQHLIKFYVDVVKSRLAQYSTAADWSTSRFGSSAASDDLTSIITESEGLYRGHSKFSNRLTMDNYWLF